MADPAYVASSAALVETATKDANITPALPVGWSAGQYAIAHVVCSAFGGGVVTPTIVDSGASGWTQLMAEIYASGYANSRSPRMRLYYRTLQGGDAAPNFQMTGGSNDGTSARIGAKIHTFSDVDNVVIATGSHGDAATVTGNGLTATVANALVVGFVGIGDSNTHTLQACTDPAVMTERADDTVSARLGLMMASGVQVVTGATDSFVSTPTSDDPWCVQLIALQAAVPASGLFKGSLGCLGAGK